MTSYDLIIVGSGPAGLAAASHAQSNGLSYALLERTDHLADTIDAYQARKYVMAEPMLIPARGEVPFQAGSRESILAAWGGPIFIQISWKKITGIEAEGGAVWGRLAPPPGGAQCTFEGVDIHPDLLGRP